MPRLLGKLGITLAILIGAFVGLGLFTFDYAEGMAYMSNDPTACTNCHVMQQYFDSWVKSSHHTRAVCNDCHLPHDMVGKYIAKADNGFRHSWANTFQNFHEPIQIIERNSRILHDNCLKCHGDFVHAIVPGMTVGKDAVSCIHCHLDVGHGS